MSNYFHNVVTEILAQGGTVDKFVGDAIFAYWNAPMRIEDHASRSCWTAIGCRRAVEKFNQHQSQNKRPIWYTRFGLHLGEAIVGNVGTGDRLDFTAVGNAVNVTARLESLNKTYGTQILASADIVERVKNQFLFRSIDRVVVKGATKPLDLYELVCCDDGDADHCVTDDERARCGRWEDTLIPYKNRNWIAASRAMEKFWSDYPEDPVANFYRERISRFLTRPPTSQWDGATHFDTK